MTYNPKVVITAAPGILGYLYLVLYEATSPTVPVANSGQIPPPHVTSEQLQFTGLNPVIHLGKLFETDGVSTVGTLLANFSIDPAFLGVEIRPDLFLKADDAGSPGFVSGVNYYTAPDDNLLGWDYTLAIRGQGPIKPVDEYTINPATGNPAIAEVGYQIQPDEVWVFQFKPKTILFNPSANSSGNLFNESIVIAVDTEQEAAEMGNEFLLIGDNSTLVVTLPDIDTVVANRLIQFDSAGGNHINAVIESFDDGGGADPIDYCRDVVSQVVLGQGEGASFFKWVDPNDNTNVRWKVKFASDDIKKVGEKVLGDFYLDEDLLNMVYADGRELDRLVYPRLWAYVQSLPAAMRISDILWNTPVDGIYIHKGKYSNGDGSTTFRIPDLRSPGILRGVDFNSRLGGSYEAAQMMDHQHVTSAIGGNNPGSGINGYGTASFLGSLFTALFTSAGNGQRDMTSKPTNSVGAPITVGEHRVANTGVYILIRT